MAWTRDDIAIRAGRELQDRVYVNLGVGIPALVADPVPAGLTVTLQSQNGCKPFSRWRPALRRYDCIRNR